MKRFFETALLVCVLAAGAYALDDSRVQPKAIVQKDSAAIPKKDDSGIPPRSGSSEDEPRPVSRESIEYLGRLRKNTPFGTKDFDLAALRAGMGSRREPTIKGIKLTRAKIGDIPSEWVLAPGADPDVRLLYLHGGGFVSGSGGFYLTLAAHLSAAAKCAVLLPDYRLAPEHRFPAGLEDCIRAHEWMIANGPNGPAPSRATFIAGDSAGGNLTLATVLALRDRRRPLPAGAIAISPTTDLTLASESLRTVQDPIISARTMPVFRELYLGKTDPRNPLASPVFGDYRGVPPLLIQAGEHEMLRDDSVRVAKKARSDGIAVKLEIWPGMFHVFQSHEPLLPEGREAVDHAADFMRSLLPRAKTVRVVLPPQADAVVRNIAGVLARQVAERCDARVITDGEAPLTVELAVAPGIGMEGFRIEDRPGGGVKIVGNDARGLLYGVGKLLRTSRYDRGGFAVGAWRGASIPEKPVRGIYFATHFHNYYHDAPVVEVQRYVEDVGLWGLNTLIVWYDMHHFKGFDSPEAVEFCKRIKAICSAARQVGLDVGFACVANEGYADSPPAIRADVKGMRGAAFPTDICTAKPEGRRYVLDNFARLYDWAADLEPKWVMLWPYDSGGCGCGQCQPWGHGGYLRIAEPLARLARHKFPGVKVMLSTWFFNGEEWAGLARAFAARPDWVDYLMAEPAFLPATPNSPPAHPSPAGLPLVGFPEISMVGWPAWGGFGANPLPTRYEREWKELKAQWQGGFPYSEGIFEDINKVLFARLYWKADTTADEALGEYIAFEYSPDVVELVLPAIRLLEKNVAPHARVGSWSLKARDLMEQADARLTRQASQAWRWRILLLRARIDAQLYLNRGAMQGRVLHDAFQELTRIYHAQNAEPAVKPPRVDPTEPPVTGRTLDFQGPQLGEAYSRVVLSSKPLAYWRMDEVAGDVLKDVTGNARSAVCDAGVEFAPPAGPRPANPAAAFGGGRISATVERLSDTYSVELWLCNDLPSSTRPITAYFFSRGLDGPQGAAGGDNLGIGGTHLAETQGKLFFFNGTKSDQVLSGKTALNPGKWHHVVLVRQHRDISVYLDGGPNPEICGQAEIGYPNGCGQLFFGGRNDGFAPLEGKLDEVSVYDRALSAEEIAAHYSAAHGPK